MQNSPLNPFISTTQIPFIINSHFAIMQKKFHLDDISPYKVANSAIQARNFFHNSLFSDRFVAPTSALVDSTQVHSMKEFCGDLDLKDIVYCNIPGFEQSIDPTDLLQVEDIVQIDTQAQHLCQIDAISSYLSKQLLATQCFMITKGIQIIDGFQYLTYPANIQDARVVISKEGITLNLSNSSVVDPARDYLGVAFWELQVRLVESFSLHFYNSITKTDFIYRQDPHPIRARFQRKTGLFSLSPGDELSENYSGDVFTLEDAERNPSLLDANQKTPPNALSISEISKKVGPHFQGTFVLQEILPTKN